MPDKDNVLGLSVDWRKKQKKKNDCITLSFVNVLLHKITQTIFKSAALIHGSIPNQENIYSS